MNSRSVFTNRILDPDGLIGPLGGMSLAASVKALGQSMTVSQAVQLLGVPASVRAGDPYKTHPWVYAAISIISDNIKQAPLRVYQEKRDAKSGQRSPARYSKRTAGMKFHSQHSRKQMGLIKGVEPLDDHPVSLLLDKPNLYQSQQELIATTILHLFIHGRAHWWLLPEDTAERIAPFDVPAQMWPVHPTSIRREIQNSQLVGWRISSGGSSNMVFPKTVSQTVVSPWEIITFRFVDPDDPLGGLSPLVAAAGSITVDMLSSAQNKSSLENGAAPSGILSNTQDFDSTERETEFREKWDQRHKGENKKGRVAILTGDWKYEQIGLSPKDMETIETRRLNREEILAVLRVPKSALFITDDLNYATQLAQDRAFVDKTLFPIWRMIEDVLDFTLMAPHTDDIFAAFDLSGIEVLRLGLKDKIDQMKILTGPEIHMPPSMAASVVGLDLAMYEGSDIALASPILSPVSEILNPQIVEAVPAVPVDDEPKSGIKSEKSRREDMKLKHWRALDKTALRPSQTLWSRAWKKWIAAERALTIEHFDRSARKLGLKQHTDQEIESFLRVLLRELIPSEVALAAAARPVVSKVTEMAYEFTVTTDLSGITVVPLDSPAIIRAINEYERRLVGTVPKTIQENLRRSLKRGFELGDNIAQLRTRVAQVYDFSATPAKTLQVARTESSAIVNNIRQEIFTGQGFEEMEWSTAQDEQVRDSHVTYGASGAHPVGFNYMELTGGGGVLEYPHDPRAPASEVVNCRCTQIPV